MLVSFLLVGGSVMGFFPITDESPDVVKKSLHRTVSVLPQRIVGALEPGGRVRTQGMKPATGFLVQGGVVVTAWHTAEQSQIAFVRQGRMTGLDPEKFQAKRIGMGPVSGGEVEIVAVDETTGAIASTHSLSCDIGLYALDSGKARELTKFAIGAKPEVGDELLLLGIPMTEEKKYVARYSKGHVEFVTESPDGDVLMLVSARTTDGWSGGPAVNAKSGQVVGVISGEYSYSGRTYSTVWALRPEYIP